MARNKSQHSTTKCDKKYPKEYNNKTYINDKKRFILKRSSGIEHRIYKGKRFFDNRHVVPYNDYLTVKYDAHICVLIVYDNSCIKYITKYMSKGEDKIEVEQKGKIFDETLEYSKR